MRIESSAKGRLCLAGAGTGILMAAMLAVMLVARRGRMLAQETRWPSRRAKPFISAWAATM